MLAIGSSKFYLWSSWNDIPCGNLLRGARHRVSVCSDLGAALSVVFLGIGVGVSYYCPNFRRRKFSGIHSRGSRHELADVCDVWGFPVCEHLPASAILTEAYKQGDVRKPYCLEDRDIVWRLQLGRIHPRGPFASRHLLLSRSVAFMIRFAVADTLSRVSTMVHEKKRYGAAFASLRRLRNTDLQAARDLFYIHAQLKHELVLQEGNGYFTRLVGLFTAKRNRTATLASFTVMIAQQMCGSVSSYNLHL
jgi:hypothetical protein